MSPLALDIADARRPFGVHGDHTKNAIENSSAGEPWRFPKHFNFADVSFSVIFDSLSNAVYNVIGIC